jgi:hypothetical protein
MSFQAFADFTHDSVPHVPAVKDSVVALYATGSADIVATAADIQKYRSAGAGVILIDQSPSLEHFLVGDADVADIESGAGTYAAAAEACAARAKNGWQSTLYISESVLAELAAQVGNVSGVFYGVADYNWSLAEAEAQLNAHDNWYYVQYGDPESNPTTLVPGTSVTLRECNADIDVGKTAFTDQFLPSVKPPPPAPTNQNPAPCEGAWRWVVQTGNKQSLIQFAAARGATVLGILKLSSEKLDAANFAKLNTYVITAGVDATMPEGLVYYTENE